MMRIAVPGSTRFSAMRPAGRSSMTRSETGAPAMSSLRTA